MVPAAPVVSLRCFGFQHMPLMINPIFVYHVIVIILLPNRGNRTFLIVSLIFMAVEHCYFRTSLILFVLYANPSSLYLFKVDAMFSLGQALGYELSIPFCLGF